MEVATRKGIPAMKTKKLTSSSLMCPRCQLKLARLEDEAGTYHCQHCGITYAQEGLELRPVSEATKK
jgi:ribosomal protein L37AE/L43A